MFLCAGPQCPLREPVSGFHTQSTVGSQRNREKDRLFRYVDGQRHKRFRARVEGAQGARVAALPIVFREQIVIGVGRERVEAKLAVRPGNEGLHREGLAVLQINQRPFQGLIAFIHYGAKQSSGLRRVLVLLRE